MLLENSSRRRSKSVDSNIKGDSTYRLNKGKETINFPLSIKPNNLLHHIGKKDQFTSKYSTIHIPFNRKSLKTII